MKKRTYLWSALLLSAAMILTTSCSSNNDTSEVSAGTLEDAGEEGSDDNEDLSGQETETDAGDEEEQTALTLEDAIEMALADAGLTQEETSSLTAQSDMEDGYSVYEVEFYYSGTEYSYQILTETGAFYTKCYDSRNSADINKTGESITKSAAKQLVLERVEGAKASDITISLITEDDIPYYKGTLSYDGVEYKFLIDAESTEILYWFETHTVEEN